MSTCRASWRITSPPRSLSTSPERTCNRARTCACAKQSMCICFRVHEPRVCGRGREPTALWVQSGTSLRHALHRVCSEGPSSEEKTQLWFVKRYFGFSLSVDTQLSRAEPPPPISHNIKPTDRPSIHRSGLGTLGRGPPVGVAFFQERPL